MSLFRGSGKALLTGSLLALLSASGVAAQPAYEVADLTATVPFGGIYYEPLAEHLAVDGKLYFFYDDGIHGAELWRTDGTALGTFLIRDICPGSCGTRGKYLSSMAQVGTHLVFVANDGVHGVEPWITDGTALGTRMIADIVPGFGSSAPRSLVAASDQVFFVAAVAGNRTLLWRTDGTTKGTYSVSPPGEPSFAPAAIEAGPGFLYLCNAGSAPMYGLWRSDGSPAGTEFVAPVECSQYTFGKGTARLVSPSGILFFSGRLAEPYDDELWRSDGTPAGTFRVKDLQSGTDGSFPDAFAWRENELIFQTSGASPSDLWRSDGTELGTVPITLPDGAGVAGLNSTWAVAGSRYFFAASDLGHGAEPWLFDGVIATRVSDVAPGPDSSLNFDILNYTAPLFEVFGNDLVFSAELPSSGLEIWRSDGTAVGTHPISDISPSGDRFHFANRWTAFASTLNGRPVFVEYQAATGERLWQVDSSGESLALIRVLDVQSSTFVTIGKDRQSLFEPSLGRICFEGVGKWLLFDRWKRDLADEFTIDLLRTDGALGSADEMLTGHLASWGDCAPSGPRLLYSRDLSFQDSGWDLLSVDSNTGIVELLLFTESFPGSRPAFLEVDSLQAFEIGTDLLVSDGSFESTDVLASGLSNAGVRIDTFHQEVVVAGSELRITDPKEPTGSRVLLASGGDSLSVEPELAPLDSMLVFVARDLVHGAELWASDGTEAGTGMILDARPGVESILPEFSFVDRHFEIEKPRLLSGGAYAVFGGAGEGANEELWVTDGTSIGTHLLKEIYPGEYPSTPRNLTRFGNRVFFTAESELEGLELWATDGTYDGTALVKDIAPGVASSIPDDLVVRDGVLYFSAWSPNYGREAWKSDGTSAGTVRITDIAPGPRSSSPQRFARAGNRLYFSATDQVHGYELWAISDDGSIPLFLDGFDNGSTSRWSSAEP